MVVQISNGLETCGEGSQGRTLRHLHIGPLDQSKDASHAFRVGRVDVRDLGVQLANVRVEIRSGARRVRFAAAGAVDVLEYAIRVCPEAHSTSVKSYVRPGIRGATG